MEARFDDAQGVYRLGDLAVSPTVNDELIAKAYLAFKAEGTLETIYYEGDPGIIEFMRQMGRAETICLGAFADRRQSAVAARVKEVTFCGMAWVYDRQRMGNGMVKAEVGFGFFRRSASPGEKVLLGQMMTQALFETYNIDVLLGTTPVDNKAALEYSKQVGFSLHGPIPNYVTWEGSLSSVQVSVLTKTEWKSRTEKEGATAIAPEQARQLEAILQ